MFYEWTDESYNGLSGAGGVIGAVAGTAFNFLGGLFSGGAKKKAAQYEEAQGIIKQQEKEISGLETQAMIGKSALFYQAGKKFHKFNKQNPIVFPLVALGLIYYLAK